MIELIYQSIDIPTLALTRGMVQLILAGLLLYLGNRDHQARGARLWAIGFLLNGISLFVFPLDLPEAWEQPRTVVNHMALGASSLFLLAGFWRFGQQPTKGWLLALLIIIPAASLLCFEWLWPNSRLRILTTASGQVLFLVALQYSLRSAPRQDLVRICRRLRYLVIAYALIVAWSYGSVAELLPTTARANVDYHRAFFSVASLLFMLSLAVGCLALQFALLAARNADLAKIDWLTGCLNRRGFFDRLRPLEEARLAGQTAISIVILDIDHFKRINDAFGHAMGDQVLNRFGRILAEATQSHHLVARMGGEEFCVVMPEATTSEAMALARSIRDLCAATRIRSHDGRTVSFTISVGVVQAESGVGLEETLRRADKLLYLAKARGRDRIESPQAESPEPL